MELETLIAKGIDRLRDPILDHYLWFKGLHLIAVMSWMAGLLYLPRLFVYHTDAEPGSEQYETFVIMERRLLKFIMNPAMIATWTIGALMLFGNYDLLLVYTQWMHAKIVLILLMSAAHGMQSKWRKQFEAGQNKHSDRFFRNMNEVPTALMIAIVLLAVLKPF